MCGIAGIVNTDGRIVERDEIVRLTDLIAHRGPDGDDHRQDDSGRQRISNPHQPPLRGCVGENTGHKRTQDQRRDNSGSKRLQHEIRHARAEMIDIKRVPQQPNHHQELRQHACARAPAGSLPSQQWQGDGAG